MTSEPPNTYGSNLGPLKGKTVSRPNHHTRTEIDGVHLNIMTLYHQVTIAIDVMLINSIPFLIIISRGLKFSTIKQLINYQIPTSKTCLQEVIHIYKLRCFSITTNLGDPKFQPLDVEFPGQQVNCCGADVHIPQVERYIRTVKDQVCSAYSILPFQRLPRIVVGHLSKNAVFWLYSFPSADGASTTMSF